MKLTVKNYKIFSDKIIVNCTTEIGNLTGIWKNDNLPEKSKSYFAELTITKYLKKAINTNETNCNRKIYTKNNTVSFYGLCEDKDNEVYYIRLNPDWLEMVDINDSSDIKIGDFVSFAAKCEHILIYPYEMY